MQPLISVIIPVYNVELYLHKCVDSILCQKFKNIEVLLVDDGSSDRCPQICDEYAKTDVRVKVIHKFNGGAADARNVGIHSAKGEYLMFVDSDDFLEGVDCFKNIVNRIRKGKPDVIMFGCKNLDLNSGKITVSRKRSPEYLRNKDRNDVNRYLLTTGPFPGAAWVTITKRKFIIDNNIFFVKGIKAEDIDWLYNLFLHADTFDGIEDDFYVYLSNREDSVTGAADRKSIESILYIIDKWYPLLINSTDVNKVLFINRLFYYYVTALLIYARQNTLLKKELKPRLKQYKYLFKYAVQKKTKISKAVLLCLGISKGSKVLYYLHRK